MAVMDNNKVADFGGKTEVGGVKTSYWIPQGNTVHRLDNELRIETLTCILIGHTPRTVNNCKHLFFEIGTLK